GRRHGGPSWSATTRGWWRSRCRRWSFGLPRNAVGNEPPELGVFLQRVEVGVVPQVRELAVAEADAAGQLVQRLVRPPLDRVEPRGLDEVGGIVAAEARRLVDHDAEARLGPGPEARGLPDGGVALGAVRFDEL